MHTKIYRIAGHNIEIKSFYKDVHLLCTDYITNGEPDFSVEIRQSDIDFERKKSADEDKSQGIAIRSFPDSYLETLAVYRKICEQLISDDIVLFHGSCVAVDGVGYLFTAKSGTGKSTHTRLWKEVFGERFVMINDDKPLLKITEHYVSAYGTPWDGKHHQSNNFVVPLKAICILERDEKNRIEQLDVKTAYPMLMQQIYRPQNPQKMLQTFTLLDKLTSHMKLYRLGCNMELQAASVAYTGMNKCKSGDADEY